MNLLSASPMLTRPEAQSDRDTSLVGLIIDVGGSLSLLYTLKYIDAFSRHLIATDSSVGGPVVFGLNMDGHAMAFLVLTAVAWLVAEFINKTYRFSMLNAVLLAAGAYYFGCAYSIMVGVRAHFWLQQACSDTLVTFISGSVFTVLYMWRFRISLCSISIAALLWTNWYFWLGHAAGHEGWGSYYRMDL